MEITSEDVLKKLKDISTMHLKENPAIGIDSLALGLNISPNQLIPLLMELHSEQQVFLHRNGNGPKFTRSNGRIDDYTDVSLL